MVAEQAERHRQREGFGNDIAQGAALPQWVAPLKVLCQAGISMLSMDLLCCFMIACGRPIRRYADMPICRYADMPICRSDRPRAW